VPGPKSGILKAAEGFFYLNNIDNIKNHIINYFSISLRKTAHLI
jgi:hypothetical protein